MTSGEPTESNRSDNADRQPPMNSVPPPAAPSEPSDTIFLTKDGAPYTGDIDFVLDQSFDTLPLPNRFRVQRLLGKGGFGSVYLATDEILQRVVAIKVPHRSSDESEELRIRFLRESRAVARLNHPSIVRILDSGESGGLSWQVAEYVAGPRLSDFRMEQGGTLSSRRAAWIIRQLADAVQHAHDQGVLHRDIKPENILLEKLPQQPDSHADLETMIPRLTDFGLARLIDDEIAVSRSGTLVGTPKYMAPEQLHGRASAQGPWTDIYSLGVVLHELLTGTIPFPEADSLHLRIAVAEQSVHSFRASESGISRDLETFCLKCLSLRPQDRYASASALRDDLTRFLEGRPTLARPLPLHEQVVRWAGRNRKLATAICLLSASIVIVFLQAIYNDQVSREQNRNLSKTLGLLTTEKQRSDTLLELAEKNRVSAEQNESNFRTLAWNSTIRECLTAKQQKRFWSAKHLLETLGQSQPENIHRPEWQLTSQELQRHYERVFDAGYALHEIAVIPGSTLLAVAGESHQIDLIDLGTFQRSRSILTDIASIHAIAVSADGKRIAVGGSVNADGVAVPMIYSLETGERLQSLASQATTIESLMFSPEGQHLVCGSRYRPVQIFNLSKGTATPLPTTRRNQWLLTSPDGTQFAAHATGNSVVISSFDDPSKSRLVTTHEDIGFCVWIPESRVLACTEYQCNAIELINIDSGKRIGRLLHSGKGFSSITASRSQRRIFAGRVDGSIVTCQIPETWLRTSAEGLSSETGDTGIEELTMTEIVQLDEQPLTGIVLSNDVLYCSSASGRISAFRFPSQAEETIAGNSDDVPWRSAAISRAGDILIGKGDGEILTLKASVIRSSSSGSASFSDAMKQGSNAVIVRDQEGIDTVGISPDDRFVGWSNWLQQVQLIELSSSDTRTLRQVSQQNYGLVDAVSFSPDSQWFAWTGRERQLFTAKVSEKSAFRSVPLTGDGIALQYSPDSSQIACGGREDQLTIFESDAMTNTRILNNCDGCTAIEWQPSGQSLLLGFIDGSIQIRPLSEINSIERFSVHRTRVCDIALSPDGSLAVSVDNSGQVAMWDAQTSEMFGVLFEPALVAQGIVSMHPALRFLNSGELILVFDDGHDGPQIHRWQAIEKSAF